MLVNPLVVALFDQLYVYGDVAWVIVVVIEPLLVAQVGLVEVSVTCATWEVLIVADAVTVQPTSSVTVI